MKITIHFSYNKKKVRTFFFSFFLLFLSNKIFSQCAGTDNSVIICNKESDTNYQTYNLFNQLGGTPTTGGEWSTDPINRFALNNTTGEINLWAINRYGEHKFTYTNTACGESATVTIFLGGYPGEDNVDGGANACSDNPAVNLYTFLDNDLTNLNADINGIWRGPFVSGEFFNAEQAGPGTYTFTYTTEAVETCVSEFATVVLEVHRAAEPGEPINIIICETEDFSLYTNINLHDFLTGEDPDGVWEDVGVTETNQIASPTDSIINIQEIYNNFGPGDYEFQYTVFRRHGVCNDESSIIRVTIPNVTANFVVDNICTSEDILNVSINYVSTHEIPFTHDLEYEIRNTNNDVIYTGNLNDIDIEPETDDPVIPLSDSHIFSIDPNPITTPGGYYITVKNISDVDGLTCDTFNILDANFVANSLSYSVNQECFNGTDAVINISDFFDASGNLSNDNININYTIQDLTNGGSFNITDQPLNFNNGSATLSIDISTFPRSTKEYNIQITSPSNIGLDCSDFTFKASLIPEDIQLDILIDNSCDASKIDAAINAPPIGDGNYTITYQVREISGTNNLIDNSFTTTNINSNLNVNISTLGEGTYEILLKSTQNDTNPCRTLFDFEVKKTFSIGGIPDTPVLDATQTFCLSDFLPNQPTIADIVVTDGENLTWYEDLTATTPLPLTTPLINGEDYFVTTSDPVSSCESSNRATVTVELAATSMVTSTNTNPTFCNITPITLANFNATVNTGTLLWYDATTGGNVLPLNTPIVNGTSYFAVESITGCEHPTRLEFIATIITPPNLVVNPNQTFCTSNFQPNQPTIADIVVDEGTNLSWYIDTTSTTPLNTNTVLTDGTSYYVTTSDPTNTCESLRSVVTTKVITTSIVTSNDTNPIFCNVTNLTLTDFDAVVTTGDLIWYDATTGGNILPLNTPIVNGTSYFAVESITGCEHPTRLEFIATIITPPNLVVNPNQTFCTSNFQPNQPTIADIVVDEGTNLSWYIDTTSTTPLNTNTVLTDGTSYYVTTSDPTNTCESLRSVVTTKVITTSIVTSNDTNPIFCNVTNLTLTDFDAVVTTGDLIWYDATTGGNVLPLNTPIVNGTSYFAVENIDGCEHHIRLEFNPTIINPPKPEYNGTTALCKLDNLTLFDLQTNINPTSNNFELLWFDAATGGNELSNSDLIEENTTYYIVYADATTGCQGERTAISSFSLSECDPDKYDFFIPDGFSPNNDGTNDQYFIPFIEYFYPNYEFEIFNRYGQSLFKGDINKPKWDGQSSSRTEVTSGVYFYVLRYNKDNLKPKQGRIYLSK